MLLAPLALSLEGSFEGSFSVPSVLSVPSVVNGGDQAGGGAGVAAGALGCGGADGFPNSASFSSGFNSIFSILIFCVRSVGELPESMAKANFNPQNSR